MREKDDGMYPNSTHGGVFLTNEDDSMGKEGGRNDRSHRSFKTTHCALSPEPGTKQQRRWSFPKSPPCCSDTRRELPPTAPRSPTLSPSPLSIIRGVYCGPTMCGPWPQAAAWPEGQPGLWSLLSGADLHRWPRCGSTPILWGTEQVKSNLMGERTGAGSTSVWGGEGAAWRALR